MEEYLKSQNLETVTQEANPRDNTLDGAFKKFFAALEIAEKCLEIESASHNDKAAKLLPQELVQSESEQKLVSNPSENFSKDENTNAKNIAQQKHDLASSLKLAALNSEKLKQRSQELIARSQQLIAISKELKIYNENFVVRIRSSYGASKYYQFPDGAP